MDEMMTFPDAWEEFEKSYGFTDNEEVYTNGVRLIPSFRVKQWLDHLPSVKPTHQTPSNSLGALDCVDRQAAIKAICERECDALKPCEAECESIWAVKELPSVHSKLEKNSKELENKNGELISRQDAMKIRFSSGFDHDVILFVPYRDVEEHLKKLPSVQPEIIRCKDCKWFNKLGCAIWIKDDSDKPTENDYCSFAEKRGDSE